MNKAVPEITVLMPAYNAERFIAQAIESVLQQDFADFELLVADDGSTDNTALLVEAFGDSRIKLLRLPHQGIAAALNSGLQQASGKYIARFDADDICLPQRLSRQYAFLSTHCEYAIVGCAADYITEEGSFVFTYLPPGFTHEALLDVYKTKCPFIHSGVMYRRDAILRAGGYSSNACTFEDHLLWAQLLQQAKGCNLNEVLIRVRLNPQSVTIDERWRPRQFTEIKNRVIARGAITAAEGQQLYTLQQRQENAAVKQAAYHALLGKKFLWNNYLPREARAHISRAIRLQPGSISNYVLLLLSFLPGQLVKKIYGWRTAA